MAQPGLLTDVHPVIDREGQRCGCGEDLDLGCSDLDLTGREIRVLVARGSTVDRAHDAQAVLVAQARGDGRIVHDDLDDAARIAQVEERDPAVVAAAGDPAGERHGRSGVRPAQGPRLM